MEVKEKKNGRPTKLTPEVTERFLNAIKLGATLELACNYAGISYQTLLNWREKKEPAFLQFFEDTTRAEGAAVVQWLARIEEAARNGNWQAASWKLERRYPAAYGRREHIEAVVTHKEFEVEIGGIPADDIKGEPEFVN